MFVFTLRLFSCGRREVFLALNFENLELGRLRTLAFLFGNFTYDFLGFILSILVLLRKQFYKLVDSVLVLLIIFPTGASTTASLRNFYLIIVLSKDTKIYLLALTTGMIIKFWNKGFFFGLLSLFLLLFLLFLLFIIVLGIFMGLLMLFMPLRLFVLLFFLRFRLRFTRFLQLRNGILD